MTTASTHRVPDTGPSPHGHSPQLETLRHLCAWGQDAIYFESRSKNPNTRGKGWQMLPPLTLEEGERIFRTGEHNIGLLLRRGTVDADLDWPEAARAVATAPERWRLPATQMWGRAGKPRSHLIYTATRSPKVATWKDPSTKGEKCKIIEFRINGHTVAPGSLHQDTGERVEWEPDGCCPPLAVDPDEIVPKLARASAAALVARVLASNVGAVHDLMLPLAGLLYYGGMSLDDAEAFVGWVARVTHADEDQLAHRLACVRDTYRNAGQNQPITGGHTLVLEDVFSEVQVRKLREWLELKAKGRASSDLLGIDGLPLTNNGDGDRFAAMWAGRVLYCAQDNCWYTWDGRRFHEDKTKYVRELAKAVVQDYRRVLGDKQAQCGQNGVAPYKQCSDHSVEMDSTAGITAMLLAAQSKREIAATRAELDAHPEYINTLDGTLELDTATGRVGFHQHRPEDRLTQLAPVHYNPQATHRLFTQYQRRFWPERDRRRFLQTMAGYVLPGYPKRHALQLFGEHDAGKSTTLKLFAAALGDYAGSLGSTNLAKNSHGGGDTTRPDLWRLASKRLVIVTEMEERIRLDVSLFKTILSGGDAIQLRTLYDKSGGTDVVFCFALWMSGNRPYGPPPEEEAAFDRLEVLKCEHVVPEAQRVEAEERALYTDPDVLDAAFAWMVAGFRRLYGRGHGIFASPDAALKAKAELRQALDPIEQLVDDVVEVTGKPDDRVLKGLVNVVTKDEALQRRQHWRKWGYKEQARFDAKLQARGGRLAHARTYEDNKPFWSGVQLREDT